MNRPTALRSGVPKTKIRAFRVPDDEYLPAQEVAARKGESLTDVVRRALVNYVRRNK